METGALSYSEDRPHRPGLWRKDTGNILLEDGKLVSPEEPSSYQVRTGHSSPPCVHMPAANRTARPGCSTSTRAPAPVRYGDAVPGTACVAPAGRELNPPSSGQAPPPSGVFPGHQPQDTTQDPQTMRPEKSVSGPGSALSSVTRLSTSWGTPFLPGVPAPSPSHAL